MILGQGMGSIFDLATEINNSLASPFTGSGAIVKNVAASVLGADSIRNAVYGSGGAQTAPPVLASAAVLPWKWILGAGAAVTVTVLLLRRRKRGRR